MALAAPSEDQCGVGTIISDRHTRSGGIAPGYVTPESRLEDGSYMAGEPSDPLFCDRELVDHSCFEVARLVAEQNVGT